jgi:hypothetical protein
MKKINDLLYKQIADDIQAMYFSEVPPPEKVAVVRKTVCKDAVDPQYYNATVHVGVNWCGPKTHAVRLRFKWNVQDGLQDMQYITG